MVTCIQFAEKTNRCQSCKCSDTDKKQYIQTLIDYDDTIISAGQRIMGRAVSLDNAHIKRIHKATAKRIEFIRAEMPLCEDFAFTEGQYENMPLHRRW